MKKCELSSSLNPQNKYKGLFLQIVPPISLGEFV